MENLILLCVECDVKLYVLLLLLFCTRGKAQGPINQYKENTHTLTNIDSMVYFILRVRHGATDGSRVRTVVHMSGALTSPATTV